MRGSSAPSEFSPAWIDERWRAFRLPKTLGDSLAPEHLLQHRLFAWLRAHEQTPALVDVDMPRLFREHSPGHARTRTPLLDWDSDMHTTRSAVPRLRPLLPEDCFPLSWSVSSASFVTGRVPALPELDALGESLLGELRRVPVRVNGRNLVRVEGVRICLADDGSDYNRVRTLLTMGLPPPWAGAPLIVASARHHGVHNPALGSAARLLELDLPRLRAERPGVEISLLGLTPDGPCWQSIRKERYAVPHVLWDVSHRVRRWSAERGATACELALGERLPLGLLLALPPREAEEELDRLAEHLSQHSYDDGEYETGQAAVVARTGELEFRRACVPLSGGSDGSAELEELRTRIAEVES